MKKLELNPKDFGKKKLSPEEACEIAQKLHDDFYAEHQIRQHMIAAANFIVKSHHLDGCEHRYQRQCNCGKFNLMKKLQA